MPISPTTLSELKKTTAQFDFLLTATNIKIKHIPPDHRLCVICQCPFDNHVWKQPGGGGDNTVNRPVRLECGHIFGIQCLAHLVFTTDFRNRCPLCRAPVMPAAFERNPSGQSWKAAVPLLRLLMMFGADRGARLEKEKALLVLQNGLEREGLTGPVVGKHMHRIMVLYEEFLNQFCDQPPPTTGDADRLAAAEERVQELRDVIREREELDRVLEESRVSEARRQELARSEAEKELRDVKEELRGVREELRVSKEGLQEVEEELEEALKVGREVEKELEGIKAEQMEKEGKTQKGWEEIEEQLEAIDRRVRYELEEAHEKARREYEGAQKESKQAIEMALKEFETTKESLKAKAALAWFSSLLALIVALAWVYS